MIYQEGIRLVVHGVKCVILTDLQKSRIFCILLSKVRIWRVNNRKRELEIWVKCAPFACFVGALVVKLGLFFIFSSLCIRQIGFVLHES